MTQHVTATNDAQSLVILGCSQRKKKTSRPIAAVERYDGPTFQVLRKHIRESPEAKIDACILSGRFGLISGSHLIPRYERKLLDSEDKALRSQVERTLKQTLDKLQPHRVFVSVGAQYWSLLEGPLSREVDSERLVIASGGIGGRSSQLSHWLRLGEAIEVKDQVASVLGEAKLLGTTVRLSQAEVLGEARKELLSAPAAARRFETWYVPIEDERVAPKWLVSILFNKPVARFRTADARRVLSQLGVDCKYASGD